MLTMLLPLLGGKRKATDEPGSPAASKRTKVESTEPESKPAMKPIPFPEKVDIPCLFIVLPRPAHSAASACGHYTAHQSVAIAMTAQASDKNSFANEQIL